LVNPVRLCRPQQPQGKRRLEFILYVRNAGLSAIEQSKNIRRGPSTRESRLLARLAGAGHQIISVDDIETTLEVAPNTAREIASRLTEKGWLDRLFPGTYLIIPLTAGEDAVYTTHEYLIAAHVAEPMYIGYYSALSHHGLTEQVPRTVYVVTPTRAQSREIHGVPYRVSTITERKFFGTEPTPIDGSTVQVSDLEKTLVDESCTCPDWQQRTPDGGCKPMRRVSPSTIRWNCLDIFSSECWSHWGRSTS
jgi:predicted transcriptional regulator of viral defense system